jgi:hypothetical protein
MRGFMRPDSDDPRLGAIVRPLVFLFAIMAMFTDP